MRDAIMASNIHMQDKQPTPTFESVTFVCNICVLDIIYIYIFLLYIADSVWKERNARLKFRSPTVKFPWDSLRIK